MIGVVEDGYPRLIGPNTESNLYVLSPRGTNVPLVRISRDNVPAALAHIDAVWKALAPKVPLRRVFMDELFDSAYEQSAEPFLVSLAITLVIAWLAVGAQAFRAATVKPAGVLRLD